MDMDMDRHKENESIDKKMKTNGKTNRYNIYDSQHQHMYKHTSRINPASMLKA